MNETRAFIKVSGKVWLALVVALVAAGILVTGATALSKKADVKISAGDRASSLPASEKINWRRFGFSASRGGVSYRERLIKPATVGGLRRIWRTKLPSIADSSPALLHDLQFPGGRRDVLYATTKDGRLIAMDAAGGKILWSRRPSGPEYTTSSPVVDPARKLVFSYGLDGRLHKYNAVSGAEITKGHWPVRITRMPRTEKESSALNISGRRLFVTTGGYPGDKPPYQGHVVSIDEITGSSTVFNSLCSNVRHLLSARDCSSERSGIWGRGGVIVDFATGSVFTASGNGPYNANTGGHNYSDSVLKLVPWRLSLRDSYTPTIYRQLQQQDADLSSTDPALLPKISGSKTPYLLVQGGKDGKLRLINRKNLGRRGGPGHLGGELQTVSSAACGTYTQPVVWKDNKDRIRVIVAGKCGTAAYRVVTNSDGATRLRLNWKTADETTTPVLAGGVLFAAARNGALLTLNPYNGRHLWSSARRSADGNIGKIHWESPIVVNGRVYISDESGTMSAYGLPRR